MSVVQFATLLVLTLYLIAFFAGSALVAKSVGRSIWLFGSARGVDRLAAIGFRASFALALAGPLLYEIAPILPDFDPLWRSNPEWLVLSGHMMAVAGAMLAFAAQMAMGASWRVGVQAEAAGDLVSEGIYTLSRNPTFLGQTALLVGVAFAIPTLPGAIAALLFFCSAQAQIRSEEAVLLQTHGEAFKVFCTRTPRWIGTPRRNFRGE